MVPCIHLPELPQQFKDALALVREALWLVQDDQSIVWLAGGCLRDHIIGSREPKDIDVFVLNHPAVRMDRWDAKNNLEDYKKKLSDIAGSRVIAIGEDDSESSKVIDSFRVYLDGPKIDIVLLEDDGWEMSRVLESFDIGLCKIAHNGKLYMVRQEFIDDLNQETIRVHAGGAYSAKSIKVRVERFKKYYPGFMIDDSKLLELLKREGGDDAQF